MIGRSVAIAACGCFFAAALANAQGSDANYPDHPVKVWVAVPAGGGVVRNMMTTREGNLVMAESALNMVALVTIGK